MLSMISKEIKNKLKEFSFIYGLNGFLKSMILKFRMKIIKKYYIKKIKKNKIFFDKQISIETFKKSHMKLSPLFTSQKKGALNIFWVGAHKGQDESGFLQALNEFGYVTNFVNKDGTYGPLYEISGLNWKNIRELNDRELFKQVSQLHKKSPINLLIGQMWAHIFSKDVLIMIRELGIPIINISMDDKLPELWGYKDGYRLGAVGLGKGIDITLTTTPEACDWYTLENMASLFWPLASDDKLFAPNSNTLKDIDVLFIGNRYGIRGKIINYLSKNDVKVTCYGSGWPNGSVDAVKNVDLSKRAKIILGVGTIGYCSDVYTLKLRDFDALMTGALYITHRNPDLLKLFSEGSHLECYESLNELLKKINYYLKKPNKRQQIGQQGKKFAKKKHTWKTRLNETFYDLGLIS